MSEDGVRPAKPLMLAAGERARRTFQLQNGSAVWKFGKPTFAEKS